MSFLPMSRVTYILPFLLAALIQPSFGAAFSSELEEGLSSEFEQDSENSIDLPILESEDGLSLRSRSAEVGSPEHLEEEPVEESYGLEPAQVSAIVTVENPLASRSIEDNSESVNSEETSNEEALEVQNEILSRSVSEPSMTAAEENAVVTEMEEEHLEKRDPDEDDELIGEPEGEIVGQEGDDEEGEGAEEPEPMSDSDSEEPEIDIDTEEHTTDPSHPLIDVDELECYKCTGVEDCAVPLDEMDTTMTGGESDPEDPKQAYCVAFYALNGEDEGKVLRRYGKLEWVEVVDGIDTGCDYRIDKEVEVCWCTWPLCNGNKFPCSKRKAANPQGCSEDGEDSKKRSASYLEFSVLVHPLNTLH